MRMRMLRRAGHPLYPPYPNWLGVSSVRGRNPDRRYPQTRRGQHSTIRKKGLVNEPNPYTLHASGRFRS